MMRKVVAVVLTVLVIVSMAGCQPNEMKTFSRGIWEDNVYINEYLGLRCVLPDGFVAATDEEMAAVMGIGFDAISDDNEFRKKVAELKVIGDMMASDTANSRSITVSLENLKLSIGGTNIDEAAYAEITRKQLEDLNESTNMDYETLEQTTVDLGGESYLVMPVLSYGGQLRQEYYLRRVDEYMLIVLLTGLAEPESDFAAMREAFAVPQA